MASLNSSERIAINCEDHSDPSDWEFIEHEYTSPSEGAVNGDVCGGTHTWMHGAS